MKKYLGTNDKYKLELIHLFSTSEIILSVTASGEELHSKVIARQSEAETYFEKMVTDYWKFIPQTKRKEEGKKSAHSPYYWQI